MHYIVTSGECRQYMGLKTQLTWIDFCNYTPGLDSNSHSRLETHVWFEDQIDKFNYIQLWNKISSRGQNITIKIICHNVKLMSTIQIY